MFIILPTLALFSCSLICSYGQFVLVIEYSDLDPVWDIETDLDPLHSVKFSKPVLTLLIKASTSVEESAIFS